MYLIILLIVIILLLITNICMIFVNNNKYDRNKRFENDFIKNREDMYNKTQKLVKKLGQGYEYDIEDSIKINKTNINNNRSCVIITHPIGINIIDNIDEIISTYNLNNNFISFLKKYKNLTCIIFGVAQNNDKIITKIYHEIPFKDRSKIKTEMENKISKYSTDLLTNIKRILLKIPNTIVDVALNILNHNSKTDTYNELAYYSFNLPISYSKKILPRVISKDIFNEFWNTFSYIFRTNVWGPV